MNFEPADQLPAMEWICWWDKTIERWRSEGLPSGLSREDTLRWFGLDVHEWIWPQIRGNILRSPNRARSQGVIDSADDYERLVAPLLSAKPEINKKKLSLVAAAQKRGDVVVWLQLDGFFWIPDPGFAGALRRGESGRE